MYASCSFVLIKKYVGVRLYKINRAINAIKEINRLTAL